MDKECSKILNFVHDLYNWWNANEPRYFERKTLARWRGIGKQIKTHYDDTSDLCQKGDYGKLQEADMHNGRGIVAQARITRLFCECSEFSVTDIEVSHAGKENGQHSFDIEIQDSNGRKYPIEVWSPRGRLQHDMTRSIRHNRQHSGKAYEGDYIKKGGIGDDREDNLGDLLKHLKRLPDDKPGFLISLQSKPNDTQSLPIQPNWNEHLPENKCVIVLIDGRIKEGQCVAYMVDPLKFEHVETAEAIVRALKFKLVNGDSMLTLFDKAKRV